MLTPPPSVFEDECFFADFPDRKIRIRRPFHDKEFEREFRTLGLHSFARRRVIVARVAPHVAAIHKRELIAIPFLAFADEEIADRDDILLPILDDIMQTARRGAR
jgi:hypothetical protein